MLTKKTISLAIASVLLLVPAVRAQFATGNVYGTVNDSSGAVLPGASITLTGGTIGARSTTSGSQGDFRFLNLDPGTYTLAVSLTGFSTVKRSVIVNTGQSVTLSFSLGIASVQETVTIEGSSPIVDSKQSGTSTTLTKEELAEIPQSRDPWATLKTVPGVLVDRVDGRLPELLGLRLLRPDRGEHGRQRHQGPDGRAGNQLRDQAGHQRLPRLDPRLPGQPQAPVLEPSGRSRGRPPASGRRHREPHRSGERLRGG